MRLVGSVHKLERTIALVRGESAYRKLLGELDGVDETLLGTEGAESAYLPSREEQDDEQRVDERGRRLEEVVVVRRDELSELVDERAKPRTADPGRDETGPPRAHRP